MLDSEKRLIELYQKMYEMTNPECKNCLIPLSCCDEEYCMVAERFALEVWGVQLEPSGFENKKGLKFMGPDGCIVPPHLRPSCTVHVCCFNALGFKPGDQQLTTEYMKLRDEIDILEWERHQEKGGKF